MTPESAWSEHEPIGAATGDHHAPALAMIDATPHLVWTWDRGVYHAWRTETGWTTPVRIAAGDQPALAMTPDGKLHCLFSHWLGDNAEIYHVHWDGNLWSLPAVVSRTSGISMHPTLAVDMDGTLHAAWTDTTPGRPVIYYGNQQGPAWRSFPIPNGSGSRPTIGASPAGMIHLAWQNRLEPGGRFEILASDLLEENWSLPENVSDQTARHSINPKLATNALGACHLIWQEEREGVFGIRHADHRPDGWSLPVDASMTLADCRQPAICANAKGLMQIVWAEGPELMHRVRPPDYDAEWWAAETASTQCAGLSDLALALAPGGEAHVVWSGYADRDLRRLFYTYRKPIFKHSAFVPIG